MARMRFFNGASTLEGIRFGDFTPGAIGEVSATKIVLNGADGQRFIAFGSGFGIDLATGTVAGSIRRIDWVDPDGGLLARVDRLDYPAQRAFDALFTTPTDPDAPRGSEALLVDALSGDDLILGDATVGGGYYDSAFNRFFVGDGNDTVKGGAGREFVAAGGGSVTFDGGGGTDRIEYLYASFAGTLGIKADLLTGRIRNPFGGADTVTGVEEVEGTIFSDTIQGDNGQNLLMGGAGGRDRLAGRGGDDELRSGFDVVVPGADDTLDGGTGNDTLTPGINADSISGGAGLDSVYYFRDIFDPPQTIVVNLPDWSKTTGEAGNDTITGVETFVVNWGVDAGTRIRFVGDAGDNGFLSHGRASDTLKGGAGNDTLDAGRDEDASGDVLLGGAGNDVLLGAGAERMDGGSGRDTVQFHEFAVVTLDLANPANSTGEAEGDVYIGIEAFSGVRILRGGGAGDHVAGTDFTDTLAGEGGNDTLLGGDRNDSLAGGAGNDSLNGGTSPLAVLLPDTVDGGTGNDTIEGMGEADILTGGRGGDVFFWRHIRDTGVIGETDPARRDVVTDFGDGADLLRFRAAGFQGLDTGFRLVQGADPKAAQAIGTFLFDTDDRLLFWDRDGSGAAAPVLLMTLEDVERLARADFEIV